MDPVGIDDQQQEVVERELGAHSFETAEARWAFERARRLRVVLRIAGAAVFLLILGWGIYRLAGGGAGKNAAKGTGQAGTAASSTLKNLKPIGSPKAKVKIEAILPSTSECHNSVIDFLTKTVKAHPDKMYVEFKNMDSFTKEQLSKTIGSACAAVLVNGSASFDVTFEHKLVHISLIGSSPTQYTIGDIGLVLTQQYKKAYGDPGKPICQIPRGDEPSCVSKTTSAGSPSSKLPGSITIKPSDLLLPSFGTKGKGSKH